MQGLEPQDERAASLPAEFRRFSGQWRSESWRRRAWLAPLGVAVTNTAFLAIVMPLVNGTDFNNGWSFTFVLPFAGAAIAQPLLAAIWAVAAPDPLIYRGPAALAACVLQSIAISTATEDVEMGLVLSLAMFSAYAVALAVWRSVVPWRLELRVVEAPEEVLEATTKRNRFGIGYLLLLTAGAAGLLAAVRLASDGPLFDDAGGAMQEVVMQAVSWALFYCLALTPIVFAFYMCLAAVLRPIRLTAMMLLAVGVAAAFGAIMTAAFNAAPALVWSQVYPFLFAIIGGATLSSAVAALVLRGAGYRVVDGQRLTASSADGALVG